MFLFDKKIDDITEDDLLYLEQLPDAFESHRLDYKVTYDIKNDKHKHEFLRDILSFANTFYDSIILYGIADNRKLIGMEKRPDFNEDILQNHFVSLLETSIVPKIKTYVKIQPISVKIDRFVIIVKIFSSRNIIFALQQKLDKTIYGKNANAYEFWYRASGNKNQMNLNEIIKHIRFRFKPNLTLTHSIIHNKRRNLGRLLKKTKTGYVKIKFRVKNIGESPANNVVIRLSCSTINSINFLNKFHYSNEILDEKRKLQPLITNIIEEIKKTTKLKSPSIIFTKLRENTILWKFQFFIDLIGPEDSHGLPPIYINIPNNSEEGEINFDIKIFSSEDVQYEDKQLTLYWESPRANIESG